MMKQIFCLLLAVLLCCSLAACGADKEKDTDAKGSAAEAVSSAAETSLPAGEKYGTIADYLETPQVKGNIDDRSDDANTTVQMDVYAEDDTLVYQYTYVNHVDDDALANVKEKLDSLLTENASTFGQVVAELQEYTEVADPKVKILYCNDDGTVITSKVYQ